MKKFNRRTVIKSGAVAIAMPALLGANSASAQAKVIKIGHVSPRTGPLAGFGEADTFIRDQVRGILGKGLQSGGKTYKVEIVSKDSQSSGSRAAESASEMIQRDKVDVTSGTPDTTNPVSDQARSTKRPASPPTAPGSRTLRPQGRTARASTGPTCSSGAWKTSSPRSLRGGTARRPTRWSAACSRTTPTATPGAQGARPTAGNAAAGYKLTDPGRYQQMNRLLVADRGVQVGRRRDRDWRMTAGFATSGLRLATGLQAEGCDHRQGLFPPRSRAGRPRQRAHLGGLVVAEPSVQVRPHRPELRAIGEGLRGPAEKPWSQPIGFQHALFEVAIDVLKRAKAIEPRRSWIRLSPPTSSRSSARCNGPASR